MPPFLKKNDVVRIVAPAGKIDADIIAEASGQIESLGFRVELGDHVTNQHHNFAGTDAERRSDLQAALDNPNISAIIAARGGYGSMRLLEGLNWQEFLKNPKWVVGYSDITALHNQLNVLKVSSLHAAMPINFSASKNAVDALFKALSGGITEQSIQHVGRTPQLDLEAEIVGGNLSIMHALLGTPYQLSSANRILFIEEIDEYVYHIDRMLVSMKLAGCLDQLKGVLIGGLTGIKDNELPFGKDVVQIVLELTNGRVPVWTNIQSGHVDDNQPVFLGRSIEIKRDGQGYVLRQ